MARCMQQTDMATSQRKLLTILNRAEREVRLRVWSIYDGCTRLPAEVEMPADKVGVKMGF